MKTQESHESQHTTREFVMPELSKSPARLLPHHHVWARGLREHVDPQPSRVPCASDIFVARSNFGQRVSRRRRVSAQTGQEVVTYTAVIA